MDFTESDILECITDLFITPRKLIEKWSRKTDQTPQARLAYPSQHIASVVTGIKGRGSAARGSDLKDGSEVKSCSRADQLGRCKNCDAPVIRYVKICPICGSDKIEIKEDSHWIFPITDKRELKRLLGLPRVLLLLFDREPENQNTLRIRIWTVNPKQKHFMDFFNNYFFKNYTVKLKSGKKPAPCNLHPMKFDFYKMEPILIFQAHIGDDDKPKIDFYNLNNEIPERMPLKLLKKTEKEYFSKLGIKLDEEIETKFYQQLQMRTKKIKKYSKEYERRQ